MQSINNGNLLEIIDLAHSLRQEHLFIANEQDSFNRLNGTLSRNSISVAQVIVLPLFGFLLFNTKIFPYQIHCNRISFVYFNSWPGFALNNDKI